MTETAVYAAGGVVWRVVDGKLRVLLIHRTKYRDVTLPKGKVDPGEMLAETAVREIHEETGIRVALGVPVGVSRYRLPSKRIKIVHYWAAEATEAAIRASAFLPNKEIAALEWVSPKKALRRLSYPVDTEILETFVRLVDEGVLRTFPIVALRHAKALSREEWKGKDVARALSPRGRRQAASIVGPLLAFGVRRIVSSPAVRCLETVKPLSDAIGRKIDTTGLIGQDAWEEGKSDARTVVGDRVRARKPSVLCSHGPVLPDILSELALATGTLRGSYLGSASALDPAAFSVVHMSVDNPGSGIVAIETHIPKD
ncbi:NUDIX domain-containing protein [Microbacterium sp. B35-30]|uniref:NUDIX hydrolase n=1 Tax=Microbacterium sp. B35-30 TaxID=1962642 RepID=UPI0013D78868|nr:NUDIX domain-containing protein [Microbacterium sp. B35-30]KAF2415832.1 DNA mismatch repair protein MutT [Microbacterium sp. B35-30]